MFELASFLDLALSWPAPSLVSGRSAFATVRSLIQTKPRRRPLEAAGVDFIEENGGGPGVRLKQPPTAEGR